MKNFKGLKRTLNKTMAMLTLCAMLISCVGVMSASADIAPGSKISTIDYIYGKLSGSGDKIFANGSAAGDNNAEYVASNGTPAGAGDMTFGHEKEGSDNIVIKSGNGTVTEGVMNTTGTISVRGLQTGFGTETKQKYEAKIKLASTNDWVDVLGYCTNNWAIFQHFSDGGSGSFATGKTANWVASPIRFKDNSIQITTNAIDDTQIKWEQVVTGLDTSKWYKVVRYMDFSVSEKNMNRVFIYTSDTTDDSSFELIYDSEQMYKCGDMPARNATQTVLCLGVEVRQADAGQVMIDDLAAYNWEAAPKASFARADYNTVGSFKNGTTINTAVSVNGQKDLPTDNDWQGFLALTTYGKVAYGYENADNENAVLKTDDGTDHRGAWVFRNLGGNMGGARKAKWELKVKLADAATDVVNVLAYDEAYGIYSSNYASAKTPVLIDKGVAKVYDGTANSWKVLCDGLESGVWYKVVRYMDFSTANVNKSRSQIFKVNTDGTETLLGDTVSFLVCGTMPYTNDSFTMRTIGADASTASGSIMFDDMFVYEIETFDLPTENVSINLGKVVACFDTAMDATTFDKTAVTLSANGTNVPLKKDAEYDAATNSITVEFNKLQYETDYTLTIAKNVMKAAGGLGLTPDADSVYSFTTEEDPFSISELAFKDAADADLASVTALNKGDTVKGCATLINTSATPREYNLILAIYKGEEMTNLISVPGTIANTTEEGTPIETEALTIADDGSRAELFVWDSWQGLRPLTEKDVIPAPAA